MVETNDIQRPSKDLIDALAPISSATAAGELARLGIRDPHIQGPVARISGQTRRRPGPDFAVHAQTRRPILGR